MVNISDIMFWIFEVNFQYVYKNVDLKNVKC